MHCCHPFRLYDFHGLWIIEMFWEIDWDVILIMLMKGRKQVTESLTNALMISHSFISLGPSWHPSAWKLPEELRVYFKQSYYISLCDGVLLTNSLGTFLTWWQGWGQDLECLCCPVWGVVKGRSRMVPVLLSFLREALVSSGWMSASPLRMSSSLLSTRNYVVEETLKSDFRDGGRLGTWGM